jgi:hypothetical protein
LHKDGLGLLWLDPGCQGPCEVRLDYDGGWELRLGRYLSFAAMVTLVLASLVGVWKRLVPPPSKYNR